MSKNIVKEIIIMLLLTLAIILILGILLYEYVPVNKIIPEKVSYVTPEKVQSELQTDTNVDDTEVVVTYQIDSTDLTNYKRIQEYVSGKKNPFGTVPKEETTETADNNQGTATATKTDTATTNDSSNKESEASTKTESNTGYLPDKGTK